MIRIWKYAFDKWYDHRAAGNKVRAALWGYLADVVSELS